MVTKNLDINTQLEYDQTISQTFSERNLYIFKDFLLKLLPEYILDISTLSYPLLVYLTSMYIYIF